MSMQCKIYLIILCFNYVLNWVSVGNIAKKRSKRVHFFGTIFDIDNMALKIQCHIVKNTL